MCWPSESLKTEFESHARAGTAAIVSNAATGNDSAGQGSSTELPGLREIAARCALPLVMGLVILGTLLWGGFVTFVMALLLWKAAGAVL